MFTFIIKGMSNSSNLMDREMVRIEQEKREFYGSSDNQAYKEINNNLKCFQCGSKIEKTDMFCSNCGDSTKDELENV